MEKCWFVLRQKHYPPPKDGKGPLQLGHVIPNLRHLDQVINNDPGPHPFPPAMAVYPTILEKLKWGFKHGYKVDFSGSARVPIPQTAGLISVGGEAGVAFQKSVDNFYQFDALDTLIIQPTVAYIGDSLNDKLVRAHIEKTKSILDSWSLFMITGLAIARAAKGAQAEENGWGVNGGPNAALAGMVEGGVNVGFREADATATAFEKSSDFIWAIQVIKISKHFLSSEWGHETYVKGATYTVEGDEDVEELLSGEGVDLEFVKVTEDDVFVLPALPTADDA